MVPPPPCTIVSLPFFIPVPVVVPVPVPYKGPPLAANDRTSAERVTPDVKTDHHSPEPSEQEATYQEEINEAINLSKNYNNDHELEEAKDLSSKRAKPVAPLAEQAVIKR